MTVGASDSSCVWTATSGVSWIALSSAGQRTGNGAVNYAVSRNDGTTSRTAALSVAGHSVTIAQAGSPPPPCSYELAPTAVSVEAGGGTGSTRLTTGDTCQWTAVANVGWITVTSPASGQGSANVGFAVAASDQQSVRTGTVTIGGRTLQVTQAARAAEPIELEGRIASLAGSCPNVSFKIRGEDVVTDGATRFSGGACADLRNGMEVEIIGWRRSDGVILATHVDAED